MKSDSLYVITACMFTISILLFLAFFPLFYYYQAYRRGNPDAQKKELIAKVAKLMVLPEGETPRVGIIMNPYDLGNQLFFQGVKKGDVVLIFSHAKQAILYDPAANKIIRIGPYIDETSQTITPKPNMTSQPAINQIITIIPTLSYEPSK